MNKKIYMQLNDVIVKPFEKKEVKDFASQKAKNELESLPFKLIGINGGIANIAMPIDMLHLIIDAFKQLEKELEKEIER